MPLSVALVGSVQRHVCSEIELAAVHLTVRYTAVFGIFRAHCELAQAVQQASKTAWDAPNASGRARVPELGNAEDEPPARPSLSAMRARIGSASLHTPVPRRRSDSHVSLADCTVLESRATYGQIHQGLSFSPRAEASGASLTLLSSLIDVFEEQEAADAAYCDVESMPRSTPWCSTGRL